MEKNILVLMTALLPSIGHKAMIDFASHFATHDGIVNVIISSRSCEPIPGHMRYGAFLNTIFPYHNVHIFLHEDDNAPQNPETNEEWDYWKSVAMQYQWWPCSPITHVIASEPYGKKMAELLNAEFIPFDIDRGFINVKSTNIRQFPLENFDKILPAFRKHFIRRVTMFGQESTGKTTLTQELNAWTNSYAIHEFARSYLEMMDDKTVTDEKMAAITEGQYALQFTAYTRFDRPLILQDTDLLSTIGYYRIYGGKEHPRIREYFESTKSHLYIVMNDEIPFEEDQLRYGGKVRESTKQFWIDLLEEFNCNYYVVKNIDYFDQSDEISSQIDLMFEKDWKEITEFVRE